MAIDTRDIWGREQAANLSNIEERHRKGISDYQDALSRSGIVSTGGSKVSVVNKYNFNKRKEYAAAIAAARREQREDQKMRMEQLREAQAVREREMQRQFERERFGFEKSRFGEEQSFRKQEAERRFGLEERGQKFREEEGLYGRGERQTEREKQQERWQAEHGLRSQESQWGQEERQWGRGQREKEYGSAESERERQQQRWEREMKGTELGREREEMYRQAKFKHEVGESTWQRGMGERKQTFAEQEADRLRAFQEKQFLSNEKRQAIEKNILLRQMALGREMDMKKLNMQKFKLLTDANIDTLKALTGEDKIQALRDQYESLLNGNNQSDAALNKLTGLMGQAQGAAASGSSQATAARNVGVNMYNTSGSQAGQNLNTMAGINANQGNLAAGGLNRNAQERNLASQLGSSERISQWGNRSHENVAHMSNLSGDYRARVGAASAAQTANIHAASAENTASISASASIRAAEIASATQTAIQEMG